ncbi:hypothetical protein E2562_026002 [Oryza meyeriana var. granulata]|uniref:Uncharacterized protein n=1 Tax=Oryza meyeriana var. granulata TaxID=110450 RepID=A0A6G1EPJ1_9ORYZ|nr:hypothetical protein E2562_026002 [Oryza meyeriana var. granulata]
MAGLQRSSETFRRSGSSGLVWDDRHLSGEMKPAGGDGGGAAAARVERSRSSGHGGYRAAGRVQPALDPPSPRVAVCGFCRFFGGKGRTGGGAAGGKAKARRR